jgi:hypothetical protein
VEIKNVSVVVDNRVDCPLRAIRADIPLLDALTTIERSRILQTVYAVPAAAATVTAIPQMPLPKQIVPPTRSSAPFSSQQVDDRLVLPSPFRSTNPTAFASIVRNRNGVVAVAAICIAIGQTARITPVNRIAIGVSVAIPT